jgi:hypothetical protein
VLGVAGCAISSLRSDPRREQSLAVGSSIHPKKQSTPILPDGAESACLQGALDNRYAMEVRREPDGTQYSPGAFRLHDLHLAPSSADKVDDRYLAAYGATDGAPSSAAPPSPPQSARLAAGQTTGDWRSCFGGIVPIEAHALRSP